MEATTQSIKRIHPLMAAAAVSVIVVSAAGAAAITGILPSSHSAPEPQLSAAAATAQPNVAPAPAAYGAPAPGMQTAQLAAPAPSNYVQSAPVVQESAPIVHKSAPRPRPVHHETQARDEGPSYAERQAEPAPRQPNYVAMGTGALIGGLLGNQVGSGNGRKLATVAGIIGGGMAGNEIANRNR
jgi:uncharacterized protein YcfJ